MVQFVEANDQVLEYLESMIKRLEQWLEDQKRVIAELDNHGKAMSTSDRYDLLLSAQAMLGYIARILKDFESWLSNPLITSAMPLDMLRRLEEMLRNVAKQFIEVDIAHTSEYKELLERFASEGKVPEIMMLYFSAYRSGGGSRRRRGEEGEERGMPRFY